MVCHISCITVHRVSNPSWIDAKFSWNAVINPSTDSFILYLKLGDGDIVLKSKDEYKVVINTRNNLTVDSLGREGEYRHIMYSLEKIEENESISIALFTDGYSNAFKNKLDLFNSIESTLQEYNKSIFSRFRLVNTYVNYLNSISKNITHDDISIVFIV